MRDSRRVSGVGRRVRGVAAAVVVALVATAAFATVASAAEPVLHFAGTVRTPEQPAPRALDVIHVGGVDYLELNQVARLFHGTKYWRSELEKMVLKVDGHRVRLTVGSPFVFVDAVGTNILDPVRWVEGHIVVPVRLLTHVIDPIVPESITWNAEGRILRVDTGDPNILGFRWDVRSNGTVLTVRLASPLRAEIEYPRPDRIVVRIPGGVLSVAAEGGFPGRGLLDSLETRQNPGLAMLALHPGPLGGVAEVVARQSPPRLLITVTEGLPEDIPLPEFERDVADSGEARDIRILVIDPGHGGSDSGVRAGDAPPEKEVTLAIARQVEQLLEGVGGLDVRLTREDDRFVSASERAAIANGAGADLFLSIHANGWFDAERRGFSIGLTGPGVSEESEGLPPWGSHAPRADRDAELFAEILREELAAALLIPNGGGGVERWAELEGARMPAIHLECGYLTNPDDAMYLADPEFRDGVAAAISFAVEEYRRVLADEGRGGS